ncbi:Hypothetical protein LUCI_2382 [Lucifera butyrica]|uniref:Uncharacterized protein n=1 Tax=Lucifera butyrica TaxID=1351585 RepID=A0A498RD73_9FIRM|nr:hypothetical protein [Lucifera butyrica]VBB07138.1 Hypothetical protein LUCI_2382 [Lucifera butyrica]
METEELTRVREYLDIIEEEKKVAKVWVGSFAFGLIACVFNFDNINFKVAAFFIALVSVMFLVWSRKVKKNGKDLFLFLGGIFSWWSLCFALAPIGVNHFNVLQGGIFLTLILLVVPVNIYLVKRNARKILCGDSQPIRFPTAVYGAFGVLGMFVGKIAVHSLNPRGVGLLILVCGTFLACVFQYCTIRSFYKQILRKRYHIGAISNKERAKANRRWK